MSEARADHLWLMRAWGSQFGCRRLRVSDPAGRVADLGSSLGRGWLQRCWFGLAQRIP